MNYPVWFGPAVLSDTFAQYEPPAPEGVFWKLPRWTPRPDIINEQMNYDLTLFEGILCHVSVLPYLLVKILFGYFAIKLLLIFTSFGSICHPHLPAIQLGLISKVCAIAIQN